MPRIHSLKSVQKIPISLDTAWSFFSNPMNLAEITPAHLDFRIVSKHHGEHLYAGQVIEYTVKPLFGIAVNWMTEITHVQHKKYFIDEQRFGPYSLWHHQHHFEEISNGILMTDIVHYRLPCWIFGDIAHLLFVRKEVERIFVHRSEAIEKLFGTVTPS
jgi:ligand-binding SRPBCC domain-containing protein